MKGVITWILALKAW